jgi:hypothetical protein
MLVQGQSWRNSKRKRKRKKPQREKLSVVSIWSYKREFTVSGIKQGCKSKGLSRN